MPKTTGLVARGGHGRLVGVVLAFCLLLAGALVTRAAQRRLPAAPAALAGPVRAMTTRTPAGDLRSYQLHLDARATLRLSGLVARPASAEPQRGRSIAAEQPLARAVSVDGVIEEVTLAPAEAGGVVALLRGRDARVGNDGAPAAELAHALATGIVVERAADGHVRRVRLPLEASSEAQGLLEHITELVQVAAPADPRAARWSGAEASVLGDARTGYEREQDGRIRKRVERVADPEPAPFSGPLVPAIDAALELVLDDDGTLRALSGRYETTLTGSDAREPVAHTVTSIDARLVGRGNDTALAAQLDEQIGVSFGAWQRLGSPRAGASDGPPPEVLEKLTGGKSLPALLADLRGGGSEAAGHLLAYLRLHPDAAGATGAALAQARLEDPGSARALGLLGLAGSDEAQAALVGVAEAWRGHADPAAETVIELLGASRTPSGATEDYLRARRDQGDATSTTAELALGRLAGTLAPEDPDRADDIVDELVAALADAPPARLPSLIAALGNSGSPAILDPLAPYLADASVAVRRQATRAVGNVAGGPADQLLAGALAAERDEGELLYAIQIVASRPVAPVVQAALRGRAQESHAQAVLDAIRAELARTPNP